MLTGDTAEYSAGSSILDSDMTYLRSLALSYPENTDSVRSKEGMEYRCILLKSILPRLALLRIGFAKKSTCWYGIFCTISRALLELAHGQMNHGCLDLNACVKEQVSTVCSVFYSVADNLRDS